MGNIVCGLGSLWIRSGCSASAVASMLAFHPPRPPSYCLQLDPQTKKFALSLSPLIIDILKEYGKMPLLNVAMVPTRRQKSVALIHIHQPESEYIIIYSHGNAVDVGLLLPRMIDMSDALKTTIVCYDYTGYGASTRHTPTEADTYADIEAVIDWVCKELAVDPKTKVVLTGQSVGSGPSVYLATKRPVAGLILESGITSGIGVLLESSKALRCVDIFPNIDRMKQVKCPVLIIHGTEDEEVPFHHGQQLQEKVPSQYKREPWWVIGYGHNNIGDTDESRAEYLFHIDQFLRSIKSPPPAAAAESLVRTVTVVGVSSGGDGGGGLELRRSTY